MAFDSIKDILAKIRAKNPALRARLEEAIAVEAWDKTVGPQIAKGRSLGEIDMRDIALNRRILVVNLPALENSDATLAALGKLVVASLRGMMAQLLGASPEGDYDETDKPGMGPSPYTVVLDELAYYATSGLDRMLSQGRGLNISFSALRSIW